MPRAPEGVLVPASCPAIGTDATKAKQFHGDVVKIAKTTTPSDSVSDNEDGILGGSFAEPSEEQLKAEDDIMKQIYLSNHNNILFV